MRHFPIPSQSEVQDFLLRLLFTPDDSFLTPAINLAYLDFCRTLRGIARQDPHGLFRATATKALHEAITSLSATLPTATQDSFDKWHRSTCDSLCAVYQDGGVDFTVGQAQKWINMAIKYCALLGDRAVPHGTTLFGLGHVPIDLIVVAGFSTSHDLPVNLRFETWSRIGSYDSEYMPFQNWVRETFPSSKPLAVEFFIWQSLSPSPTGHA